MFFCLLIARVSKVSVTKSYLDTFHQGRSFSTYSFGIWKLQDNVSNTYLCEQYHLKTSITVVWYNLASTTVFENILFLIQHFFPLCLTLHCKLHQRCQQEISLLIQKSLL